MSSRHVRVRRPSTTCSAWPTAPAPRRPASRGCAEARAEDLEKSARSGSAELLTGTVDRLLRRLSLDLELDAPKVRGATSLPKLDSVRIGFDLALSRPNAPVRVPTPPDARSFEELDASG